MINLHCETKCCRDRLKHLYAFNFILALEDIQLYSIARRVVVREVMYK